MNSVLKNIKTTLRQLFGFDEIEKTKNGMIIQLHQDKMDIFQAKRQKPLKIRKLYNQIRRKT